MSYFNYKPKSDPINWAWGEKRPNNNGWWYNVSENFNLTQFDVRAHQDNIHWYPLSRNRKFSFDDDFLAEFEDKIQWADYVDSHKISEKTFLRFRKHITVYQFLSNTSENKLQMAEKYFEQAERVQSSAKYYHHNLNKKSSERLDILEDINLPEKFFEAHCKDEDDWSAVARCQRLSERFIKRNRDKLDEQALLSNYRIKDDVKQKIKSGLL